MYGDYTLGSFLNDLHFQLDIFPKVQCPILNLFEKGEQNLYNLHANNHRKARQDIWELSGSYIRTLW